VYLNTRINSCFLFLPAPNADWEYGEAELNSWIRVTWVSEGLGGVEQFVSGEGEPSRAHPGDEEAGGRRGYARADGGPFACTGPFLSPSAKTAPSRKAVMFNGQTLAEAEPGLI